MVLCWTVEQKTCRLLNHLESHGEAKTQAENLPQAPPTRCLQPRVWSRQEPSLMTENKNFVSP